MTVLKSEYHEKILEEIKDLPKEQVSNLLKIIHIFKESIIYQSDIEKFNPREARRILRGLGKGDRLTERLLKTRSEDIKLERR